MSLHPQLIPPVPEETARVARAAFPKGNLYLRMRDELGVFYEDQQFAHLYPTRGQAAKAPWRLALITLMQYVENLSDRQAAEAVRVRIDWKYALSLELTDTGFDFSVLSEFRDRLLEGGEHQQLLNVLLVRFQQQGLFKVRGQQRTDSTYISAAVREMTRLEFLGETLRYALNALAQAAPVWLQSQVPSNWYDCYGTRFEDSRLPKTPKQRETLAASIGADGFRLLDALYAETAPTQLRSLMAVNTLRQVWLQQYYAPSDTIQLRPYEDGPPAAIRIRSPYDLEARRSTKYTKSWTGYKVHLTESCDDQMPRLITHVETTAATMQDQSSIKTIHQALAKKGMPPQRHVVDQGYTSAQLLVKSRRDFDIELFGPVASNVRWQAQLGQGFDLSHFQVDWKRKVVHCPQGKRSRVWKLGRDAYGNPVIHVEFSKRQCLACPVRSQCTRSAAGPRSITLKPHEDFVALQAARARQTTEAFKQQYAIRAGVEGTLSQGVRAFSLRQCRYTGLAKAHLQHIFTAAAMNLVRVVAWLEGIPLARTRQSSFSKLAPSISC